MKRIKSLRRLAEKCLHRAMQLAVLNAVIVAAAVPLPSQAQDRVLNLYSARHYQTDEALYSEFTKQTGIKIKRIEAGDEQLLQRLKAEGANSPADVLILVDAARLWRAQIDGLFQTNRFQIAERGGDTDQIKAVAAGECGVAVTNTYYWVA